MYQALLRRLALRCPGAALRAVALLLGVGLLGCALLGCPPSFAPLRPELLAMADHRDALGLVAALDRLIDEERVTDDDRESAYHAITLWEDPTAGYAFARAALAGRVAQIRGLSASGYAQEVEQYARLCQKRDPGFRDGAATRMLGTLYVLAPSAILKHGDSEAGLDMLEKLTAQKPAETENHLRLAEAYIALGDPDPAGPHLCLCHQKRASLRRESR